MPSLEAYLSLSAKSALNQIPIRSWPLRQHRSTRALQTNSRFAAKRSFKGSGLNRRLSAPPNAEFYGRFLRSSGSLTHLAGAEWHRRSLCRWRL